MRIYVPGIAQATAISPANSASWEDATILYRAIASTIKLGDALQTIAFTDSNAADRDVLFFQLVSAPLAIGQTVTGAQAIKAQCRVIETATGNNMFLAFGIRIINVSTVQKTVLDVTRDAVEADAVTLTNRQFTATSAATNYTTVNGDRIVIEGGMGGDPGGGQQHSCSMRLGSSAALDLTEDDVSVLDSNPWIELTDTLTFILEPFLDQSIHAGTVPRQLSRSPELVTFNN